MEYTNLLKFMGFVDKVKYNSDLSDLRKTPDLERIWKMAVNDKLVRQLFDHGHFPHTINNIMLDLENRAGMLFAFKGIDKEEHVPSERIHDGRHAVILEKAIAICGGKSEQYIKGSHFLHIYNEMIRFCREKKDFDNQIKIKVIDFLIYVRDEETNSFLNEIELLSDYFLKNNLHDLFIDVCNESRVGNGLLGYSCFEGYIERLAKIVFLHHRDQLEGSGFNTDIANVIPKLFSRDELSRGFIVLQMLLKEILLPNYKCEIIDTDLGCWTYEGKKVTEEKLRMLMDQRAFHQYMEKCASKKWDEYEQNKKVFESELKLNELGVDNMAMQRSKIDFRRTQHQLFGFDPHGYEKNDFVQRAVVADKELLCRDFLSDEVSAGDVNLADLLGITKQYETQKKRYIVDTSNQNKLVSDEVWCDKWLNAVSESALSLDDIVIYVSQRMKLTQKHILSALTALGVNKDEILANLQYFSPRDILTEEELDGYINSNLSMLCDIEYRAVKSQLDLNDVNQGSFLYNENVNLDILMPGGLIYQKMIQKIDEYDDTMEVYYCLEKLKVQDIVRLIVTDKCINLDTLRCMSNHIINRMGELSWSEKKSIAANPNMFVACYSSCSHIEQYKNFLNELDNDLKESALNPNAINIYPQPSYVLSFGTMILLPELKVADIYKRCFLNYKKQKTTNRDELLPLHHAGTWGCREVFQDFLPHYDIYDADSKGYSALARALFAPDLSFIVRIMEAIAVKTRVNNESFGYDQMSNYLSQFNVGMGTRREQIAALLVKLGISESNIRQNMTKYNKASTSTVKPSNLKEWLLSEGYIEILSVLIDKGHKLDFENNRIKRLYYQGLKNLSGFNGELLFGGEKFVRCLHAVGAPLSKTALLSCAHDSLEPSLDSIDCMRYILNNGDFEKLNIICTPDQSDECVFQIIFKQSHPDYFHEILNFLSQRSINISDIGTTDQKYNIFNFSSEIFSNHEEDIRKKLAMMIRYQRRVVADVTNKSDYEVCESFNSENALLLYKNLKVLELSRFESQQVEEDNNQNRSGFNCCIS